MENCSEIVHHHHLDIPHYLKRMSPLTAYNNTLTQAWTRYLNCSEKSPPSARQNCLDKVRKNYSEITITFRYYSSIVRIPWDVKPGIPDIDVLPGEGRLVRDEPVENAAPDGHR